MSDVGAGGNLVLHQRAFDRLTLGVVGDIFGQCHTDALQNAALRLHTRKVRVDRGAAVNGRHKVHDLRFSGFGVDFQFGSADHKRRGRQLRAVGHSRLQRRVGTALTGNGNLRQRYRLLPVSGFHPVPRKLQSVGRDPKHLRCLFAELFDQLLGAQFHGFAGDIGRAGRIGTGIVGRGIGIRRQHGNILQRTFQHLGGDLRQDGVAAGTHIGSADPQRVEAVVVEFQRSTAHVHRRNAGALHCHTHTDRADLAVGQHPHGVLVIPVDAALDVFNAAIQRAAGVLLVVVGGHDLALFYNVAQAQLDGVNVQLGSQFVDGGFHRKQTLCGAVTAVRTRRHMVGIHHIVGKAKCLRLAVQRDRLMPGQAHRRGTMLTVGTRVGQGVQVDRLDDAVFVGTQSDMHFHLMARGRGGHTFAAGKNQLAGLFGHPCDKRRVDLAHGGLLGAKAAADAGLADADHTLGNMQGVCQNAAAVENDLGRAEYVQPPVGIDAAIGAEGFHHRLLARLGVIHMVDHDIAALQHSVHIAAAGFFMRAEVALVVGTHGTQALPVVFGMDQHGVILRRVEIQHRLQHLVLNLDELHRLFYGFFVLARQNGNNIAHKAHMAVQHQTVVGAGFGIRLPGLGVAATVLVNVLPSKHRLHARHQHGAGGIYAFDHGVRVGRAQQLDGQAVLGGDIIQIHRLPGHQLHGVLFADGLVYGFHWVASFCFFHARKFCMPRSCPS